MASMNVSLSEQMKAWVEAQIESGLYHNASEYIRDLIRRDQGYHAQIEALRAHLGESEADYAAGRSRRFAGKDEMAAYFADRKGRLSERE
jgi:antitoxin ParD1/3/4